MSRLSITLVIATFFFSISSAQAQEQSNFYFGGGIGVVFDGNTRSDGVFTGTGTILDGQRLGPEPGKTAKGSFDPSPTVNVTFGYDMGKRRFGRWRFEGELFYQKADSSAYKGLLDGVELDPVGSVSTTELGVVLNALFDIGEYAGVKPFGYVGYGRANAETEFDFQDRGAATVDGNVQILQAGFGASIPFNDRMYFDVKYRFRRAGLNENGLDTDIDANILEVGMRYPF